MKKLFFTTLVLIFLIFGVWSHQTQISQAQIRPQGRPQNSIVKKLNSAKNPITIAGRNYKLESYIWQDSMPTIGVGRGNGMIASVRIIAVDKQALPDKLLPDKLWVIRNSDKSVWETNFTDEPRISNDTIEMVARSGPQWSPGSSIQVVVRVKDQQGKNYLLRQSDEKIQQTF
jgi:hypothetical protein